MSANIKASVDGTQAIIGVGGVDQMTVSNAGVVTANSFVGAINNANVTATGSTTARTLANRFADVVNVKDFGADPTGAVDSKQAIQDAINAGASVYFPYGTYYCADNITVSKNIVIKGDGAKLLFASGKRLTFSGIQGNAISLTSNVLANSQSIPVSEICQAGDIIWLQGNDSVNPNANITLSSNSLSQRITVTASSSVFSIGDVGKTIIAGTGSVYIYQYTSGTQIVGYVSNNNAPISTSFTSGNWSVRKLYAQSRPYYERGELTKVESYASGIATIDTKTYLTYTAGQAFVYRIQPIKVYVENLQVETNVSSNAITCEYLSDSNFIKIDIKNSHISGNGMELKKSYGSNVLNCSCNVNQYGILFSGSQECIVDGGNYTAGDHAIEFSSGSNTPSSRRILCSNVSAICPSNVYAINCHAGADLISIRNNQIIGGISTNCSNTVIENNTINFGGTAECIRLRPEIYSEYLMCISNTVYSTTASAGIDYRENFAGAGAASVQIQSNYSISTQGCRYSQDISYKDADLVCKEMIISNNSFRGLSDKSIEIDLVDKAFSDKGISFIINGNNLKAGNAATVTITTNNYNIEGINLTDNIIIATQNQKGFDVIGIKGALITSNEIIGLGTGGTTNEITSGLETLIVSDNFITNFTEYNGFYYTTTHDRKDLLVYNNVHDNCFETGGTTSNTYAPFAHLKNGKNRWSYASAAPTGNTWQQGDITFNDNPVAGGTLGWVCTTSGTPGTWKTFGQISA